MSKEYGDESEERILNDDYKNWKKSVAFLYDMVMTHALHWPSFTLQWFNSEISNGKVDKSKLLLGATTDSSISHVLISDVFMPSKDALDSETPFGTFKPGLGKIEHRQRFSHSYAVKRARFMPQRPHIIATISSAGTFGIYDTSDESFSLADDDRDELAIMPDDCVRPIFELSLHNDHGSCMAWNKFDSGCIIGAGRDHSVALWNVCAGNSTSRYVQPMCLMEGHTSTVNDVVWWETVPTVVLSASSDGHFALWDVRSNCLTKASHLIKAHNRPVTSVASHPMSKYMFASGGEDGTVALWDVRNLRFRLHSLCTKSKDSVLQLRWSPHSSNLLASSNTARSIHIWDLNALLALNASGKSDQKQAAITDDDPPELVFSHGGHSSSITDFDWHPDVKNVIGSTASDNIVQIWKPIHSLLSDSAHGEMEVGPNIDLDTSDGQ